jgi:sortase (surface protein transpeptidase)
MDVPSKYASTGWLRTGSKPGNPGTAVIAGHYGWLRGKPNVFTKLDQLQKGDEIAVFDRK